MQKLLTLALCGVLLFAGVAAFSGDQQTENVSWLSRLKVGQPVRLERALSGGYNVNILNDTYIKSFQHADATHVPAKIIEVGRDFIVVDAGRGFKQTMTAHAIHVITELPDAKEAATETDKQVKTKE